MKILLLGDASNYHCTLGRALAAQGHEVTVASNGSRWMQTGRHIDLSRRPGRLGGALLWTRLHTTLASRLRGYDVVQVHNPVFLELRPGRVREVFDSLRRHNGRVFLTALGTDTPYVDMCLEPGSPLRYSDFSLVQPPELARAWQTPPLSDHCRYVYDHIDGAVSALYEYHLACARVMTPEKLAYAGIPVEIPDALQPPMPGKASLRILVACHKGREREKGVDMMLPPIQRAVQASEGRLTLDLVQDVPVAEFARRLDAADIVVDQLYSYTPATSALMAMARGKAVVSGGEEDYYRFIGEERLRPIINPDPFRPECLEQRLLALAADPQILQRLSGESIEFVRRHNAADVVASRFVDFWGTRGMG